MAKTNKVREKKNDLKLAQDIASFKASLAFILMCFLIGFVVFKFNPSTRDAEFKMLQFREEFMSVNYWLLAIPFVLVAIGAVIRYLSYKNGTDERYRYFSTYDLLGILSLLSVLTLVFYATVDSKILIAVIIGFALGYYVKRFFEHDFYVVTLINLAIAFGLLIISGSLKRLWICSTAFQNIAIAILLAGTVICGILFTVYVIGNTFASKNKKVTSFCDKLLCVFYVKKSDDNKMNLFPAYISLVVGIILGVIIVLPKIPGLSFGFNLSTLTAEIILLVQYVALGVYYTIRQINH